MNVFEVDKDGKPSDTFVNRTVAPEEVVFVSPETLSTLNDINSGYVEVDEKGLPKPVVETKKEEKKDERKSDNKGQA